MKKLVQMVGLFIGFLLIAVSCQNENLINQPASQGNQLTLTANKNIASRTHFDGDQTVWSEGDQIYVSSQDGNVTGVLTLDKDDAGKSTGTFTGFVFGNPDKLAYSVYPVPSNGVIDLSQISGGDKLDAPMVGPINNKHVQFVNTCGILRVNLQNAIDENFTISAKAGTENVKLHTIAKVVVDNNGDANLVYSTSDSSDGTISLNNSKGGFMYIPYYINKDVKFYVNNIEVASAKSDNFIGKVVQKDVKTLVYSEKTKKLIEPTEVNIDTNNITTGDSGEKKLTVNVSSSQNAGTNNSNVEVHEFVSIPSITESLENSTEEVNNIVIELPKVESSSSKTSVVSFDEIPNNITVTITEETNDTKTSVEELTIILPSGATEETLKENVVIDMPNTTVTIQSTDGEVLLIEEMEATTADETLIVHKHVRVGKLNVKKGKVEVHGHIGEIRHHHKGEGGKKPQLIIKPGGSVDQGKDDFDWKDENKPNNENEETNDSTTLLLPTGSNFNSIVAPILKSNSNLNTIKFIANSKNTSNTLLVTDENRMVAYIIINGNCLEIHTSAKKFVAHWDSSKMFFKHDETEAYPISYYRNITSIDFGENFDTSGVRNMTEMFAYCTSLTSLSINKFDTSNTTSMQSMFIDCKRLATIDVSSFDTSKVLNMSQMFRNCSSVTSLLLNHFDTSKVLDMSFMFCECYNLSSLDISSFDTSKVTDMRSVFSWCTSLTSLDVSHFDTSNVDDMYGLFYKCEKLNELKVGNFNTSKVTDMGLAFTWCSSLASLDLSNWDTSKVTNMDTMFGYCKSLTTLNLKGKFNTSNVENMQSMFESCSSLTSLNVSNFETSNVKVMNGMFVQCKSLLSLDLSSFNTSNVTTMSSMFSSCFALKNINVSSFNLSKVTDLGSMFHECYNLAELDLTSFSFDNSPTYQLMLYLTGKESGATHPISIKVSEEGYNYLTAPNGNSNTGLEYNNYAKLAIVTSESESNIDINIGSWEKGN